MWEEAFDDIGLSSKSKSPIFNLPFFRERTDLFLVFLIVISSIFILIISVNIRTFHLWAEFLRSNTFIKISTYPLLISGVIVLGSIVFRTIIWFLYKPQTIEPEEKVSWPLVSVIMPALNESF